MSRLQAAVVGWLGIGLIGQAALAQALGPPDRGEPGDEMIQAYLAKAARGLDAGFLEGIKSAGDWRARRDAYRGEYLDMLGLAPLPERTPLKATITGKVEGDRYVVENLHYQSVPGLYVTANLYHPKDAEAGVRRPAVLYVCGHSGMGRNGNKTAFQSHGIWLARHGYVCLMVDTLQLGEIEGVHHGTYQEGRWWWLSRGYTPAGVECWNGVRGIDYLVGRPDVDPERIGVTGISGGGAATFWIAAADDRVKVAVPVSGMADLESYVGNRVVDGHCDCMFLHNSFQWPWTRIAGLIAPRPLLFVNSDQDAIFPMDANERVIARLERLYSLFGAGDRVDAVVSVGGHDYRRDIRQAAFRFLNIHLKGDARSVEDSEVDLVTGSGDQVRCPIEPGRLRAFASDSDIPADQKNTTIDRHFVPMAKVEPPGEGGFAAWRDRLMADLRRVVFRGLPGRIPAARGGGDGEAVGLETEPGIAVTLHRIAPAPEGKPGRVLLVIADADGADDPWLSDVRRDGDAVYRLEPRGVGRSRWSTRNPPNYVERSLALLGQTADGGRIRDVASVARWLRAKTGDGPPVIVAGHGAAGVLGAYAALLEGDIGGAVLIDPPSSHMDEDAPVLLNVLRVLDIPDAVGLLAPRPLTLRGAEGALRDRVNTLYDRGKASEALQSE